MVTNKVNMKALVLSGGGWKAVYQVGVLRGLLELNPELSYDIYLVSSAGALNASILASGNLKEQILILEDIWLNQIKGNYSIWKHKLIPRLFISMILPFSFFIILIFSQSIILSIFLGICSVLSWYLPYYIIIKTD